MYVTVSNPRCGCHGVPFGSPGAYSTSPIWSMCTNGSRSCRCTPAKARRTGNPSPSSPCGAVVTDFTGRSLACVRSGSGTGGSLLRSLTVTAGTRTSHPCRRTGRVRPLRAGYAPGRVVSPLRRPGRASSVSGDAAASPPGHGRPAPGWADSAGDAAAGPARARRRTARSRSPRTSPHPARSSGRSGARSVGRARWRAGWGSCRNSRCARTAAQRRRWSHQPSDASHSTHPSPLGSTASVDQFVGHGLKVIDGGRGWGGGQRARAPPGNDAPGETHTGTRSAACAARPGTVHLATASLRRGRTQPARGKWHVYPLG